MWLVKSYFFSFSPLCLRILSETFASVSTERQETLWFLLDEKTVSSSFWKVSKCFYFKLFWLLHTLSVWVYFLFLFWKPSKVSVDLTVVCLDNVTLEWVVLLYGCLVLADLSVRQRQLWFFFFHIRLNFKPDKVSLAARWCCPYVFHTKC